jgi:signal transduction histidine kinase
VLPAPAQRLWNILPYAAAAALLVLAVLSLSSVRELREKTEQDYHDGLQEQLEGRVSVFERTVRTELDDMIAAARDPDADLAALQALWRRSHPWFDALYVWRVAPRDSFGPEVRFLYPAPRHRPDGRSRQVCDERARRAVTTGTRAALAAQYLVQCADMPLEVRAWASAEAAAILRADQRPHDALVALELPDLDDDAPLRTAPDVGPAARVQRRLLFADLLDDVGEPERAARVRLGTVTEILALDAPDLEASLYLVPKLIDALEADGRDVSLLRAEVPVAEQRLAAFREIRQTAARHGVSQVTEGARFTYDQYSDAPYLLYSLRLDDEDGGVALQLSQEDLLEAFLTSAGPAGDAIAVVDVAGRGIAGARGAVLSDISAPFKETLRHLRAVFTHAFVVSRAPVGTNAVAAFVGTATALCVILGLGAILAQRQANQRAQVLLQRQRDFTARVTHELKTPLAGMRVMAENLAAGAFRDERQRAVMAQRIVDEADRLTKRVEEILQLSKKPKVPDPEPFDLEEVLLELVDEWGPRYEQAGVRLQAEIDPTDTLVGDADAVRDAFACLLDNAMKYRREDRPSHVWLNARQEGTDALVEVIDDGLGVPSDMRVAIFERFVRVEGPNRGLAGGHGLGLAQVKEIVTAHKGSVRCDDGEDGGARFTVRLPTAT